LNNIRFIKSSPKAQPVLELEESIKGIVASRYNPTILTNQVRHLNFAMFDTINLKQPDTRKN